MAAFLIFMQNSAVSKKKNKFKVGDKVIGNNNAHFYAITKTGWVGTVSKVISSLRVELTGLCNEGPFEVVSENFDLLEDAKELQVGDTVKYVGKCNYRPEDLNSLGTVTNIDRHGHPHYLVEWDDCIAMNREGRRDAWYNRSDLEYMEKVYVTESFYE